MSPSLDVPPVELQAALAPLRARLAGRVAEQLEDFDRHQDSPPDGEPRFKSREAYERHIRSAAVGELRKAIAAHCRPPPVAEETNGFDTQVWSIVGGEDSGGILVRTGQSLKSNPEADRLAKGALVEQLKLSGERLHYRLLKGAGPREGWVSIRAKNTVLAEKNNTIALSRVLAYKQALGESWTKKAALPPRKVVIVALMAAHLASEEDLKRLRGSLKTVSQQVLKPGEAQVLSVVSWHAASLQLVASVRRALDQEGFPDLPSTEHTPDTPRAAVRSVEPLSHFQHLQRALDAAEDLLGRRRASAQADKKIDDASVWVMFGSGGDLWNSRRIAEYACAIHAHPMPDGIGAVATFTQARCARKGVAKSATTDKEVESLLTRGHALRRDEEEPCRGWSNYLCHVGDEEATVFAYEDLVAEHFDFCPRLRLLREFFQTTSSNVLKHPSCGARLSQFLLAYPHNGEEAGLLVHFFQPVAHLCWMYFRPSVGAELPAAAQQDQGDSASPARPGAEATEVQRTREALAACRFFSGSSSKALDEAVAAFRVSVEGWLLRRHGRTVDERGLDQEAFKVARTAFASLLRNIPRPRVRDATVEACRACRGIMKVLAEEFDVKVVQCREEACLAPTEPPDHHEERGQRIVKDIPSKVLANWEQSTAANRILREHAATDNQDSKASSLTFKEALGLLEKLHLSLADVAALMQGSSRSSEDDSGADAVGVLAELASPEADGQDMVHFRHIYRLLELLGVGHRLFVLRLGGDGEAPSAGAEDTPTIGNYAVLRELGRGMGGCAVYLGEHLRTSERVALKWPVDRDEVVVMQELYQRSCSAGEGRKAPPGVPTLLASGVERGGHYFASELLGPNLSTVFQALFDRPLRERWAAIRVIGVMLLRRLRFLHEECGYVHGDMAPHNILIRRTDGGHVPYLIDFGCARRFPGDGQPVDADKGGSMEFSSIRSADGSARCPEDDVEALGWTLVNGVFGELPWFHPLQEFYKLKDSFGDAPVEVPKLQAELAQRVRRTKESLLENAWSISGTEWQKFDDMPEELDEFMRECRARGDGTRPNYSRLAELLEGPPGPEPEDMERREQRQWEQSVTPLLDKAHPMLKFMLAEAQLEGSPSARFAPGESVHVWSVSKERWILDGMVSEVAEMDLTVSGGHVPSVSEMAAALNIDCGCCVVPQDSVRVTYDRGAGEKWILPWEQHQLLRRVPKTAEAEEACKESSAG